MWKWKCWELSLLISLFFFQNCNAVLSSNQEQPKPSYSSGIKTKSWQNPNKILTHQNYSRVVVHNNPNSEAQYSIITQTERTVKVYPVYNAHSYGPRNDERENVAQESSPLSAGISGAELSTNRTIYKRKIEYSTLEVYEKCPSGATGQFIYSLSCNQFLNCWKGRGSPQNCALGTLFNPKTLECDLSDKVECITGPHHILGNIRLEKSAVSQVSCPDDFTGLIPNYTDCSKFINCNHGQSHSLDCPPGTLFDINQNVCDFPYKTVCFNGETGKNYQIRGTQSQSFQEQHVNPNLDFSTSSNRNCGSSGQSCSKVNTNQNIGQGTSTIIRQSQQNQGIARYDTYGRLCNPVLKNCVSSGGQSTGYWQQGQSVSQSSGQNQNGQVSGTFQSGTIYSSPSGRELYGESRGHTQSGVVQSSCNPVLESCHQQNRQTGSTQSSVYGQTENVHGGQVGVSQTGHPQAHSYYDQTIQTGCNPAVQNCGRYNAQTYSQQGYGQIGNTQSNCNPALQNCAQQSSQTGTNTYYSQTTPRGQTGNMQTGCNPALQYCGQQGNQVGTNTYYSQVTSGGQSRDTQTNCNPALQNCGQHISNGGHSQGSQVGTNTYYSQVTSGGQSMDAQTNCNPAVQNCGQQVSYGGQPQGSQVGTNTYYSQVTSGGQSRDMQTNCNPVLQNCGQQASYGGQPQGSQVGTNTYYSQVTSGGQSRDAQTNCNPALQNCGQQVSYGSQSQGYGQTIPGSNTYSTASNIRGGTNANYGQTSGYNRIETGSRNYNKICNVGDSKCQQSIKTSEPKCPNGFQGITKHPTDCKKFLNCANGQTFIQDCAPGTLFNPKLGNCDFPYNVDCQNAETGHNVNEEKHTQNTGGYTEQGNALDETTTEYYNNYGGNYNQWQIHDHNQDYSQGNSERNAHTPKNIDYVTEGPNPIQTNNNLDYIDVFDPNEKNSNSWPPPFPKTSGEFDYEFEYDDGEPVTIKPENVYHASQKKSSHCEKEDFRCTSNSCITQTMVCDGRRDCDNGKDEYGCEEYIGRFAINKHHQLEVLEKQKWINVTATTCAVLCIQSSKFNCRSFNYRRIDRTCLLSDTNVGLTGAFKKNLPFDYFELKTATIVCADKSKYFECPNKKCILKTQVCDGFDDCGDRRDEKNCRPQDFGYSIKLTGTSHKNEGRIEITAFGQTGYICDDKFGISDANVVCRELGFELGAAEVKGQSFFGKDLKKNILYMMDDLECRGNETSLLQCDFAGWGVSNCREMEVVGVICKTPQERCGDGYWKCDLGNECVPNSFICDGVYDCSDNSDEANKYCEAPTQIRLVNGQRHGEGRLEVMHHGVWGTICDDDFNEDAAKVVCKHLGFKGRSKVKKDAYFGSGNGPIWLDQVSCYGNETTLEKCTHWNWGEHNCDHSEDVGITCTNEQIEVNIERNSKYSTNERKAAISGIPNGRCGFQKNTLFVDDLIHARVVSGTIAKKGDYPWQAALRVTVKEKSAHWCGAVIISSKWVLTAAHCLQGYAKGAYLLVAGEYNTDEDEGTEQKKYIEDFFVHEKFRKGHKMNNDIALIKLKGTGFILNDDVQPICLPDADTNYNRDLNCTISGFGSVKTGTSGYSHDLMAAWIPIHSDDICKMPHIYGSALTEGMFCAGFLDGGVDACDGDSGGPLACLDNGLFTLYGVTSWGQHCGYANKPGVYVKVAHYRQWIDDIIQQHSEE